MNRNNYTAGCSWFFYLTHESAYQVRWFVTANGMWIFFLKKVFGSNFEMVAMSTAPYMHHEGIHKFQETVPIEMLLKVQIFLFGNLLLLDTVA